MKFQQEGKERKPMPGRIEVNPEILLGKPVIAGTRIPVYLILNLLASGYDYDRIIEAYPGLTKEDIPTVLRMRDSYYSAAVPAPTALPSSPSGTILLLLARADRPRRKRRGCQE